MVGKHFGQLDQHSLHSGRTTSFDKEQVARTTGLGETFCGLVGVFHGDRLDRAASSRRGGDCTRFFSDRDEVVNLFRVEALADQPVTFRRSGPEFAHLPQHREPTTSGGKSGERVDSGRHRIRISVVTIIQDQPAL